MSTFSRSAAVTKRSGSGLACETWSRVTTTASEATPSISSAGRALSDRPLVAIAQGTCCCVRYVSSSRAPGSRRTWSAWRRNARWWPCCMCSTCSSVTSRPISRSNAFTNRPPLMPIRRWMRHTASWISLASSASRQARTCWYTLSTRVPSRSKRNAGPVIVPFSVPLP